MNCELYECRNCFHSGPLTKHGRCEICGSESVMSQEVIVARGRFMSIGQYNKIEVCSIFGIPPHLVGTA